MVATNVHIGAAFLVQVATGTLGNLFLLSQYLFHYFSGCRSRATDLILRHLTVANLLVILSRGIPETMAAFGFEDFLSDLGCKLVFYVHRVGRGVSMSSTCLLSVFQATTISPRSSKWTELNVEAKKYTSISTVLCWLLHMLLNVTFPATVTAKWRNKNVTSKLDFAYCSGPGYEKVLYSITTALFSISDTLCMGLMICTSSSMVSTLYKHKKQVQHIYKLNVGSRSSPVTRATDGILVLVCTYVHFYTISCIIQVYLAVFQHPSTLLLTTAALINTCFPTLCPFVLMSHDHSLSKIFRFYCRRNTVI
ncbi:PREDICTED: vomeronasal type-1 receptor 2-like [Chinchilla lanigera]|uniref:vomeronasal type-1 receptor 2-like n=1 Tax=Chinchilla lanigera TaxID=34839 RepID=UPI00038EE7EA|nr:PREDICTED: vomeronasal type-1 receptor 2-like [Chinchilla lanigera]